MAIGDRIQTGLLLAGTFRHGILRSFIEPGDHIQHSKSVRQGAREVIIRVLADAVGTFQRVLLILGCPQ